MCDGLTFVAALFSELGGLADLGRHLVEPGDRVAHDHQQRVDIARRQPIDRYLDGFEGRARPRSDRVREASQPERDRDVTGAGIRRRGRETPWLGVLEAGFFAGYVALAALLHVAWHRLVRAAGGTEGAYLVSVLLFYLLAAGTGLGMYQFLQDAAFLPSNIANVAMLWGVLLWADRDKIRLSDAG